MTSTQVDTIDFLSKCHGKGTSLVTLIMRAGSQPGDVSKRVTTEMSAASNIKDRVNRLGVKTALRSVLAYTKGMKTFGDHGVAIFAGQCV